LLSIFVLHGVVQGADKVRIAVPEPNAAYLTFPLAQKKGFLAAEGFEAEVVLMRGTLTIPALNAGDIDCLTGLPVGVRDRSQVFLSKLSLVICRSPAS
jgi:ABC-type nitrate/sulfonate/bicarbonate transport system substrate-binding protein